MQTFLPFPDFVRSVQAIDWKRLGKQRVEADQILTTIRTGRKAWSNHPAVRMWRGFEVALCAYRDTCIREWIRRGYNNTMPILLDESQQYAMPSWFGQDSFHLSHQSNLVRKLPSFYGTLFPGVPDDIPYVWPV